MICLYALKSQRDKIFYQLFNFPVTIFVQHRVGKKSSLTVFLKNFHGIFAGDFLFLYITFAALSKIFLKCLILVLYNSVLKKNPGKMCSGND